MVVLLMLNVFFQRGIDIVFCIQYLEICFREFLFDRTLVMLAQTLDLDFLACQVRRFDYWFLNSAGCDSISSFFLRFIYLFKIYLFLLENQSYGVEVKRQKGLPPTGSLPKWLQRPHLGQSEVGTQELLLNLPCCCRGPRTLVVLYWVPRQ